MVAVPAWANAVIPIGGLAVQWVAPKRRLRGHDVKALVEACRHRVCIGHVPWRRERSDTSIRVGSVQDVHGRLQVRLLLVYSGVLAMDPGRPLLMVMRVAAKREESVRASAQHLACVIHALHGLYYRGVAELRGGVGLAVRRPAIRTVRLRDDVEVELHLVRREPVEDCRLSWLIFTERDVVHAKRDVERRLGSAWCRCDGGRGR